MVWYWIKSGVSYEWYYSQVGYWGEKKKMVKTGGVQDFYMLKVHCSQQLPYEVFFFPYENKN